MCTGLQCVVHCLVSGLVLVFSPASPVTVLSEGTQGAPQRWVSVMTVNYLSQTSSGTRNPSVSKAGVIEMVES